MEEPTCTKVYYASRTHSQLAQVIGELHRLRISSTIPQTSDEADERTSTVRVVSLGSRKQLCINKSLTDSSGDLDEKCRELLAGSLWKYIFMFSIDPTKPNLGLVVDSSRQGRTKPSFSNLETRFWYLRFDFSSYRYLNLRQAIPKDIEDLAASGKLVNICPYFGSRKAIKQAQVCL